MVSFKLGTRSRRRAHVSIVLAAALLALLGAVYAYAAPTARPKPRPTAPAFVTATARSASAIVQWKAPDSSGTSKITGYRVTAYTDGVAKARRVVGVVTHATVTGLTNGQHYSFQVAAINAHGFGVPRASRSITIAGPSADQNSYRTRRRYTTTTTTRPVTTTTKAPVASSPAPTLPTLPPIVSVCVGTAMTRGQADIDAAPTGTTFCLSGTHNWKLTPKSGDRLIGPAVLDGGGSTITAIAAETATNVVISNLEIRNYRPAVQQGAIYVPENRRQTATGWILNNLSVHDNGANGAGAGAGLGKGWQVLGGRYYNNSQEGIGGSGGNDVLDGVELDHNDFTDHSYTTANLNCGIEAGGMKWVASNVTVKNSKIHDNGCAGLWTDGSSNGITIVNNDIYNNWNSGVFIEISSNATITGNTITNNGWQSAGKGKGCPWLWGGGITIASSDHVEIAHNIVTGNCNGITGTQQNRGGALLANLNIHDNTVSGGGRSGAV